MSASAGSKPGGDFTVIGAFHALMDGKKVRIFPSTGIQVDPSGLGSEVTWEGDNIGYGGKEFVTLTDQHGNWADIPARDI